MEGGVTIARAVTAGTTATTRHNFLLQNGVIVADVVGSSTTHAATVIVGSNLDATTNLQRNSNVAGGVYENNSARFEMTGGEIRGVDNVTAWNTGVLVAIGSTFVKSGGIVHGATSGNVGGKVVKNLEAVDNRNAKVNLPELKEYGTLEGLWYGEDASSPPKSLWPVYGVAMISIKANGGTSDAIFYNTSYSSAYMAYDSTAPTAMKGTVQMKPAIAATATEYKHDAANIGRLKPWSRYHYSSASTFTSGTPDFLHKPARGDGGNLDWQQTTPTGTPPVGKGAPDVLHNAFYIAGAGAVASGISDWTGLQFFTLTLNATDNYKTGCSFRDPPAKQPYETATPNTYYTLTVMATALFPTTTFTP